ncbi:hypothetical protein [Spirosoma sp.]|uniref:hypothetical protein n=1 Tax=Spirosoma sp. TaxID=1899569 RepID=UPI002627EFA9|nr:hypothetical protein [Spirosoma sp.]MCX6217607.1 hypothetical protein [Spirosoma sp.]
MGASLKDFVSDPYAVGAPLRIAATGKKLPKGNYIALALVPKNTLPDIGSATTFTPPPSGTAAPVTVNNIVSVLQALAWNGQAWVFGNGVVNGKRGKPKEDMEKVVFGSRRSARPTGEVEETYDFTFKYFYLNRLFFNQLRYNFAEYDIYAFTDRSVETLRYDLVEPTYLNIGDETTGSNSDEIGGGFQIILGSDGQPDPDFISGSSGFESLLGVSQFKYTFSSTITTTVLVNVLSGAQFNMTAGAGGTITRAINQTVGASVVKYSIFSSDGSAPPALCTINSSTGVVTIGSLTAGTYNLKVIAENTTGVMGEWAFKVVAA